MNAWLGRYQIQHELGRGGMGAVYLGRSVEGQSVAIKLLLDPRAREALQRFDRERRLLSRLGEADGFVPLLDAGLAPPGPYIVMPFVGGGTLAERIEQGPLSVEETLALGMTLAGALGRAHAQGIVHRDLKPANVLFTGDGRALIADLGLAKHFRHDVSGASDSVQITEQGATKGTVGYMPPEQIRGLKNVGPQADVFSLGVILYECLLGRRLFQGLSVHNVVVRINEGDIPAPRSQQPDVPAWLSNTILRALSPDPSRRHADGEELFRALEEQEDPGGVPWAPLILGGVVLLLVLVLGLAVALGPGGAEEPVGGVAATDSAPPAPVEVQPPRSDPAQPALPVPLPPAKNPLCRGFLRSTLTRLKAVYGDYAWKLRDRVHAFALLPEDRVLAVGSDGGATVFDARDGRSLVDLQHSVKYHVSSVAASPDGKLALTGSADARVRLWDLSGERPLLLKSHKHKRWVRAVAFTPDGKTALSAGGPAAWVFGVVPGARATLRPSGVLKGHTRDVLCLAVSRDGAHVLTGSNDGTTRHWDLAGKRTLRTFRGHTKEVNGVAFHPTLQRAYSASGDGRLIEWNLSSGEQTRVFPGWEPARAVAISPDGRLAAVGYDKGALRVWETASGREAFSTTTHWNDLVAVRFTPDGGRIVTGSSDCNLKVWDAKTGQELGSRLLMGHRDWIPSLAFTPDGRRLLSGSHDETIKLWDLARPGGPARRTSSGHTYKINGVDIDRQGRIVVSGSEDLTVRVWDMQSGDQTAKLEGHYKAITDVAVSGDGKHAVSASQDNTARLWDLVQRRQLQALPHPNYVNAVAFTPAGRVVSGGRDKTVRVWSRAGKQLLAMKHRDSIDSVAVSADGRRILAGDYAGEARLWDAESGQLLLRITGHAERVPGVAFSPDGRRAATASHDQTIRIWDLSRAGQGKKPGTAREVDRIHLGTSADYPLTIEWSADGRYLASGTGRGVVLVFELDP